MFTLKEEYRPAAQMLLTSGTCPKCVLRFCGIVNQAPYGLPYKGLICDLHKFLAPDQENKTCSQNEIDADCPPFKKIRLEHTKEGPDIQSDGKPTDLILNGILGCHNSHPRTCNVCLGILQDFCEVDFVKKVCQKVQSAGHEFKSFIISVSLPPQLSVREVSSNNTTAGLWGRVPREIAGSVFQMIPAASVCTATRNSMDQQLLADNIYAEYSGKFFSPRGK